MFFQKVKPNPFILEERRKDVVSFFYQPKESLRGAKTVFVWDLDKTYLDTQIESLRALVGVLFEKAVQKRNVPGTAALVQRLSLHNQPFPIFFISASPPQMQERIREKWEIDKIKPYGFFSKDNLKNLRFSRWKKLRNHIGFKLQALMELRLLLDPNTEMVCWGDDSESDANIYSLFSDLCAHRLINSEAKALLSQFAVPSDQQDLILELRDQRKDFDPLSRVYINLAVDTDPEYYRKYGRRLMAVENTFEIAVDLYQRSFLDLEGVILVGEDLVKNYAYRPFMLESALKLLAVRSRLAEEAKEQILTLLKERGLIRKDFEIKEKWVQKDSLPIKKDFEKMVRPWVPERIDYLSEY